MSSRGIDFYGTNLVPGATASLTVAAGNDDTRLAPRTWSWTATRA
jgi:hypothetical protein